jgi:hypothetical protein
VSHRRRTPALLCIAAAAGGLVAASATAAQGAVKQSVYTVTKITQTSQVQAGFGGYSWTNGATLRYRAAPGANLARFDFPTKSSFDPFFRGGANPAYGVLQVKARSISQTGEAVQNGVRCAFAPAAPADERDFRVQFYRASRTAKTVRVQVTDQDAAVRVDAESRSGRLRAAGCDRMPSVGSEPIGATIGDDYRTSFAVPRATFRRAKGARPVTLVLRGVAKSRVTSNPGVVGTLTVTTTVTMRLMSSR